MCAVYVTVEQSHDFLKSDLTATLPFIQEVPASYLEPEVRYPLRIIINFRENAVIGRLFPYPFRFITHYGYHLTTLYTSRPIY
jgi:hypothetical protein